MPSNVELTSSRSPVWRVVSGWGRIALCQRIQQFAQTPAVPLFRDLHFVHFHLAVPGRIDHLLRRIHQQFFHTLSAPGGGTDRLQTERLDHRPQVGIIVAGDDIRDVVDRTRGVSNDRVQRIGIRDRRQSIRFTDAGTLQHPLGQPLPFQCAPAKVRVQAIEGLFVDIHDNDLMTSFEEVVAQFRAHASTPHDNQIHTSYSFSSSLYT
jgi:hypothetical protein